MDRTMRRVILWDNLQAETEDCMLKQSSVTYNYGDYLVMLIREGLMNTADNWRQYAEEPIR